jgi:hypothetical protein
MIIKKNNNTLICFRLKQFDSSLVNVTFAFHKFLDLARFAEV